MIIDVNAYFGTWPYWGMDATDPESLLMKMDKYGIDRAFVCSLRGVFQDTQAGNAETLDWVSRHPDRFAPALTYSPYGRGRERYREELCSVPGCLVKLFPIQHSYEPQEEPFITELLDYCGGMKIPVLIPFRLMMSWRFPTFPVQKIGTLAGHHPNTRFILGSINYLFELQAAIDVLKRNENMLIETSAMMAFEEVAHLVRSVGSHRLLHGTCMPLQNPAIGPLKIQTAEIPQSDKDRILAGTAIEVFGSGLARSH